MQKINPQLSKARVYSDILLKLAEKLMFLWMNQFTAFNGYFCTVG